MFIKRFEAVVVENFQGIRVGVFDGDMLVDDTYCDTFEQADTWADDLIYNTSAMFWG